MPPPNPRFVGRRLAVFATRLLAVFLLTAFAAPAFAQQMVGESLLLFAGNYVVAPLGIFSMCLALGGAFFRPDLAKHGLYAALLCALVFFIIKNSASLTTALRN